MPDKLIGAVCPKAGRMILTTAFGANYVIETQCKTWGCKVCQQSRLNEVKEKMTFGLLVAESSVLTTLTLRTGLKAISDAAYVGKAQAAFFKRLNRHRNKKLSWLKIPEMTKQMMPHLHMIILDSLKTNQLDRCKPREFRKYDWYWFNNCQDKPQCLQHEMAEAWYEQTGSWVVDVQEIYNVGGAVNYLTKYLTKSMLHREELEDRGFMRRWGTSRNWPRDKKRGLVGSLEEAWVRTEFLKKTVMNDRLRKLSRVPYSHRLLKFTQDPIMSGMALDRKLKGGIARLEKLGYALN